MSTHKVHNVKFYNLQFRSVTCLALNETKRKLALSRHDNSIEIWNITNSAFIEKTIPNQKDSSIEALQWINSTLYSCGLTGMIVEYDLSELTVKDKIALTGGAAWCMDLSADKTRLAIGTEDGYINTFFVQENSLVYERIFDKQTGRILCIKWDNTGKMIFTGSLNTLRIWNSTTGHAIHKMTTSRQSDKKLTTVWCLAVTDDNMLVSGDSRGILSFWDTVTGTLIESHQPNKADILAIALSKDRNTIYCAGVDTNIRIFSKLRTICPDKAQWIRGVDRNFHKNDIRALVCDKDKLFSAGVEGVLAISSYPPKHLTKHPPILQAPCVLVCEKARCVMLKYVNYLEIWRLGSYEEPKEKSKFYQLKDKPMRLLQLKTKSGEMMLTCAISRNAKTIVYSTDTHVRIFEFDVLDGEANLTRSETELLLPRIQKAVFSPKSKFFVAINAIEGASKITLFRVEKKNFRMIGEFDTSKEKLSDVNLVCFSPDNKYLICSDCEGKIAVYEISENLNVETMKRWGLPKYHCPPTAMAVQKKSLNLVVVYSDHKVLEYNIPERRYTEFSNHLQNVLPPEWYLKSLPILNVIFDPNNENIIIMHDRTSIYVINKEGEVSTDNAKGPKIENEDSKEDSSFGSSNQSQIAFRVVNERKGNTKYEYLVHLDWLNNQELVAVEVNEESLIKDLPPVLKQKFFGM